MITVFDRISFYVHFFFCWKHIEANTFLVSTVCLQIYVVFVSIYNKKDGDNL